MIRTEAERQFYLGAAGIQLWYARAPLPGAAASPEYDFGVTEVEPAPVVVDAPATKRAVPTRPAVDPGNKDRLAQLKNLMETGAGKPDKAAPLAEAESQVVDSVEPDSAAELLGENQPNVSPRVASIKDIARLCLQFWVGDRVLLLANLSEEASFSMQEALARNILRSLGEQAPDKSGVIQWPLFNNVRVSLNSDADLTGLLQQSLSHVSDKSVITLGFGPEAGAAANILSDVVGRRPEVVFDASLAALAGNPVLKRELWQKIRALGAKD
ncbi:MULTISPECIES: hypothetical protein [Marinobacter]|uniref:hypothetical protein n=1 Tax=Marinobacter TaxID=2742 RepID=UPI003B42B651|nr:hypothetical protein PBN92_04000 [Marinobacter alkaliphilus]